MLAARPSPLVPALAAPEFGRASFRPVPAAIEGGRAIPLLAALLVTLPVFLQAPWVRLAPWSAAWFTLPLLALGLALETRTPVRWQRLGVLLVGFSGSWLAGCLFWGWCRSHPLWHLPIEAFALPLALGGLGQGRWRTAACFYLASLLGTACTDAVIAASGLMGCWAEVVAAGPLEAASLLQQAAQQVLQPLPLVLVIAAGWALLHLAANLRGGDTDQRLAAAVLATTVAVDGLFLMLALAAPALSGLI